MKSRLRGLLGSLVILASAPVLAESDGEALFREISAEMGLATRRPMTLPI
jgi:hypothetical protein